MNLDKAHLTKRMEDAFYGWCAREKVEATPQGMESFKAGVLWLTDFMGEAVAEIEREQRRSGARVARGNDVTNLWGLIPF